MADHRRSLLLERLAKFEAAAEIVAVHLRHALRSSQLLDPRVVPTRVSNRVKTVTSILRKISQKKRDGLLLNTVRLVENHINDLAGARIVCDYLTDIALVHAYLQRHPAFKVLHTKTKDYVAYPQDGYRGVHLVVQIQTGSGRVKCEIQLRTMLQHAWAEKNQDLLYKLASSKMRHVPREIRTLMENQSDFLYNIDVAAVQIAAAVRRIQRKVPRRRGSLEVLLFKESVKSKEGHPENE